MNPEDDWYRRGIFYELHVRAFADSNRDGIGDFPGLISKLDYLEELGVTALWLLPFYPSPLRDDGYDTSDYRSIHPDYGDMRSFRRFLREAHRRDLRVITELVVNHTSDQHEWFQRARRAPKGSRHRDFYVWSDDPERYRDARIIFSDFETSNWTWDPVAGSYYWHRFYSHQPDLNYDNPAVQDAVFKVCDFWLDMGVDGMRLDAVPYLFEREGTNCENLPETHAFLRSLRSHVDERYEGRVFLAEANQWPEDAAAYFGEGDECHMNFHFPLMPRLFMAVQSENRLPIEDILEQTPTPPEGAQWATFLRNHDELTLEMVTDEERDYLWRSYAHDPRMRINLGIRRRLAPLLGNDRRKIELLNSILFSLPGTPVIYYGDELGLGDNVYLGDRDGVRTPMQWSPDRNAGFSAASPQRLYLPPITEPGYHYENVNVEAQAANPNSLLWWMRQLIALRRRNRVLALGDLTFLDHANGRVLAYLRSIEGEDAVLCVANLSRHAQAVELDLSDHLGAVPVELFGHTRFAPIGDLPYYITLGPYGSLWFALTTSSEERQRGPAWQPPLIDQAWRADTDDDRLASALHGFMADRRWYAGKGKVPARVRVTAQVPLAAVVVLRVSVSYTDASSDDYAIPVTEVAGERAAFIARHRPAGVIARLDRSPGGEAGDGLLIDAMVDEPSVLALAQASRSRRARRGIGASLEGHPSGDRIEAGAGISSLGPEDVHLLGADQSNTSAVLGSRAILKLIRRLGPGENPDLEIGRHLAARPDFTHTAPVLGALTLRSPAHPSTLAMMHVLVENEGDAWSWALAELDRFLEEALATSAEPNGLADAPEELRSLVRPTLDSVELLGRRTGELHRAMAGHSAGDGVRAFDPETFSAHYQRSLYQGLRSRARELLLQLRNTTVEPDPETAECMTRLADDPDRLFDTFNRLRGRRLQARRIRIHGDLHLGQILWTGRDFVFIDFEGEPNRALGERRIKRSPLVDVAGLVRSFHYASSVSLIALAERGRLSGHDHPRAEAWARWWQRLMTDTLVEAYVAEMADTDLIPTDRAERQEMLRMYVVEKAMYEVQYELQSRPDWVIHPLRALQDLIATPMGADGHTAEVAAGTADEPAPRPPESAGPDR